MSLIEKVVKKAEASGGQRPELFGRDRGQANAAQGEPARETLVEKAATQSDPTVQSLVQPETTRAQTVPLPAAKVTTRRRLKLDFEAMRRRGLLTPTLDRTRIAEEFRLIKRPLLLKAFRKGPDQIKSGHLIMVTSSRPGEGKTFNAISLAMSIASERDLTVLLVDADFAKPSLPEALGFDADVGLVDVLNDESLAMSEVLIRTNLANLSILPAGRPHPSATELLASERMARFVEEIADRYSDRVIILDAPPTLASSEPGVLAMHVGQAVYVVEEGRTSESAVREGLSLISACKHIGLVLNKSRSQIGAEKFGSYYGYAPPCAPDG